MDDILKINSITKTFPRVIANKDLSFTIKKNSVHALLGENGAGKSTLVKILYGLLKPDSGYVEFNNERLEITSPSEARMKGIGMVFQHFSLFESLTVRENLILGIDEKISYSDLKNKLNNISSKYELPLDLEAPITTLSAGEKQRVEIVRILLQDPQLLIMDEPTSVLTPQEVTNLFKTLDALVNEGRTILYITHKLEEVINLCDEVTIMRNGELIDSCSIKNQTAETLATKMLGERLGEIKTDYSHVSKKINFKVNNLSVIFNDPFLTDLKNVNFDVKEGEIFGIAGVAGNGQSELMDFLTGENINIDSGSIIFNNQKIETFNPKKRRDLSIAFVPENRLGHSAVPELSLSENILLSQFPGNNFTNTELTGQIAYGFRNGSHGAEHVSGSNDQGGFGGGGAGSAQTGTDDDKGGGGGYSGGAYAFDALSFGGGGGSFANAGATSTALSRGGAQYNNGATGVAEGNGSVFIEYGF